MPKLTAELYQIADGLIQLQGVDIDGKRFICTYEGLDDQLKQDWESLQEGALVHDWDCDEYKDENWIYPFDSSPFKIAILPDDLPEDWGKEKITHFVLVKDYGVYVKEAEFFTQQGGKTMLWGVCWEPINACDLKSARKLAIKMRRERYPDANVTIGEELS